MSKEVNVLHYCGDCLNKVVDESLPKGAFRCPLIAGIIQTDIVWYNTDATDIYLPHGLFGSYLY